MKNLIVLFLVFFLTHSCLFAQLPTDFNCAPVVNDTRSNVAISGGLFKPCKNAEGEYLRVLVAFVQFQGDNSLANDWQAGNLPGWAYQFINTSTSGQYTSETLSDFWDEMALGDFDVIGNVFPDLIILPPESNYANAGKTFHIRILMHLRQLIAGYLTMVVWAGTGEFMITGSTIPEHKALFSMLEMRMDMLIWYL